MEEARRLAAGQQLQHDPAPANTSAANNQWRGWEYQPIPDRTYTPELFSFNDNIGTTHMETAHTVDLESKATIEEIVQLGDQIQQLRASVNSWVAQLRSTIKEETAHAYNDAKEFTLRRINELEDTVRETTNRIGTDIHNMAERIEENKLTF